jgi:hypothetical protein
MSNTKDTMVSNAIASVEAIMLVYSIPYIHAFDIWALNTLAGSKVKEAVYNHLVWYNEPKIQDYK